MANKPQCQLFDLDAIQAPLLYADGDVAGSSHTWCETYTHP